MAWHFINGRQYGLVGDAFCAQQVNELLAQAFVAIIVVYVGGHFCKSGAKLRQTER